MASCDWALRLSRTARGAPPGVLKTPTAERGRLLNAVGQYRPQGCVFRVLPNRNISSWAACSWQRHRRQQNISCPPTISANDFSGTETAHIPLLLVYIRNLTDSYTVERESE